MQRMVMTVLLLVPFYAVAPLVTDPGVPIVQVFTFFPHTAPVTALLHNGFVNLPTRQTDVVIAELVVLTVVMLQVAVQIFRYGSIAYTEKVKPARRWPAPGGPAAPRLHRPRRRHLRRRP